MRPHRVPPAVKIALGYLVFAVAWVLVSDRVLDALVSDAGLEDCWQTVKGTVFVVASAVFVYFLTRRYLDRAEASTRRLAEAYDETLAGWAAALDIRDHSTGENTARVTALAVDLGRRLGLSDDEIEQLRRGAILHDIGKMALPDRVLSKPGPLDEEEWALMRQHPDLAVQMLTDVSFLAPAMVVPAAHHERWDGVPARPRRGGDPVLRAGVRGGRRLRRADVGPHVPEAGDEGRGARPHRPGSRRALRSGRRARVRGDDADVTVDPGHQPSSCAWIEKVSLSRGSAVQTHRTRVVPPAWSSASA